MDLLIANHLVKLSPKNGVGADLTVFQGQCYCSKDFHFFFSVTEKEMESLNGVTEVAKMDEDKGSLKVYRLVKYIEQQEYPFDTHDDTEEIMNHFGIAVEVSSEEKSLLLDELRKMAEQEQTNEITQKTMEIQDLIDEWGWDNEN
jgi:hypothetical protein